jgi:hypothetical protein
MADLKRVFSIGYEFDDERVQNTEFHEPDSSLGHDLIYWDPSNLAEGYDSEASGTSIFLSGESARTFAKDRERRTAELQEHLRAGKPIVIAVPAPRTLVVSGRKFEETIRFDWPLVDPLELLGEASPSVTAARGRAFELASDRAFSKFWEWAEEVSTYECYFTDPRGIPLLRIAGTDKVVAIAAHAGGGVILLLPRLDDEFAYEDAERESLSEVSSLENPAHKDFLNLLWIACRQFMDGRGGRETSLPGWTDEILIPGEKEALEKRTRAESRMRTAERAIQQQEDRLARLRERKILISGTGPSLEHAVDEAFRALGFDVEPGPPGRTDRILRRKRRTAVVEIKGKSKSASEKDAAQLEKWRSDFHATHGFVPKGVLVVNAWKGKPLDEREELEAFPNQMLAFAGEQRGQCLLTGTQLLGLWLAAEKNPRQREELARSIMSCEGIYPDYGDWRDVVSIAKDRVVSRDAPDPEG